MIIFDLDGTLANCEHRRYLVDPSKHKHIICNKIAYTAEGEPRTLKPYHRITGDIWNPDWDAFYEACDRDEPIFPIWDIFNTQVQWEDCQIWSGRSESVREKTIDWLMNKCPLKPIYWNEESWNYVLKMRAIGNTEPDEVFKGRWLDEAIAEGKTIEYVFDDSPKMVRFWKSRGIFCFNVNQGEGEF